jgi:hypothetical protein
MDRTLGLESSPEDLEGWIPAHIFWEEGRPTVDWCFLGKKSLSEPFYNHTVEGCLRRPFNQLFRHRTPIDLFDTVGERNSGLQPTAFIFHMSRCGSTLVSQMLARLPENIVISEASPIDSILHARFRIANVSERQASQWLHSLISLLGQRRTGEEKHFFVKFDYWHLLDFQTIRRAFPRTPCIFLYRDPLEVMISQNRRLGPGLMPGTIEPKLFGLTLLSAIQIDPLEYRARALRAVCQSALKHPGELLLVNYDQLPAILFSVILNRLGIHFGSRELEIMHRATAVHSKDRTASFEPDAEARRRDASEHLTAICKEWLYPVYSELESLRIQQSEPGV